MDDDKVERFFEAQCVELRVQQPNVGWVGDINRVPFS